MTRHASAATSETGASARPGHPVPDPIRFLHGAWQLTKLGRDSVPGRTMRYCGQARFSSMATGLLFEERGTVSVGAYLGEATRRYVFHIQSDGTAEVCFENGTFFHHLNLGSGGAHVWHNCVTDRYEGCYRVLGPDCWIVSWRVTGPRKRQVISSRFIRKVTVSNGRDDPSCRPAR